MASRPPKKIFDPVYTRAVRPRCFTEDQWRAWNANAQLAPPTAKHGVCADCTPAFQQRMLAENRCDHPGVLFELDADGALVGKRFLLQLVTK